MEFWIISSLFLIFGTYSTAADDPENGVVFRKDYTYLKAFDSYYKAHRVPQNWTAAVAYCRGESTELAVPNSAAEVEAVVALLRPDADNFWIGLHDIFSEGEYITLNGTSVNDVYSNWGRGEPNNDHRGENCAMVNRNGFYNDGECFTKEVFVCKKPAVGLTLNKVCETFDKAYFYSLETDRCYKYHNVPMSWYNAFRICKTEESQLAVINSVQEAKIFVKLFEQFPADSLKENFDKSVIHLGFNELITPGLFLTVEGKLISETGYENWSPGQPDNRDNVEHCGSMFRDGTLNDVDCNHRCMFICEKALANARNLDLRLNGDKIQV